MQPVDDVEGERRHHLRPFWYPRNENFATDRSLPSVSPIPVTAPPLQPLSPLLYPSILFVSVNTVVKYSSGFVARKDSQISRKECSIRYNSEQSFQLQRVGRIPQFPSFPRSPFFSRRVMSYENAPSDAWYVPLTHPRWTSPRVHLNKFAPLHREISIRPVPTRPHSAHLTRVFRVPPVLFGVLSRGDATLGAELFRAPIEPFVHSRSFEDATRGRKLQTVSIGYEDGLLFWSHVKYFRTCLRTSASAG